MREKEKILLKYYNGTCNREEYKQAISLLDNNDEGELKSAMENQWDRLINEDSSHFENKELPDRLSKRIKQYETSASKRISLAGLIKYAAVMLLMLSIGGITGYLISNQSMDVNNESNSVYVFASDKGSRSEVTLPDGSVVLLNSKSKITYQKDDNTQMRLVTLEGEAFFDVVHNENSPFLIDFGDLKIEDLGTKFNVKAYPDDKYIETKLVEGLVNLQIGNSVTDIQPGDIATYSKLNNNIALGKFDKTKPIIWMSDDFIFQDMTLLEIMDEIGKWYDIQIIWENTSYQDKRFYIDLKRSTSLEVLLDIIKINEPGLSFDINDATEHGNRVY